MEVIEIIIIFSIIFITTCACLIFFPHYIRGAISGNWEIDIGEWWNEFVEYKQINLLVATLVLYLTIIVIWIILNAKIHSKKGLVLGILSSLLIIFCVNKMYWIYLDNSCLQRTEWWSVGGRYIQIYGSIRKAQFFVFLIIAVFLILSIVSAKFNFFIKDPLRREIVQKIVSKTVNLDIVICFGLQIYLILPEIDIFVYQSKTLNVVMYFLVIGMMLYLIYDLAVKINYYKKFLKYCLQAKKDYKERDIWIVVNENNMNEESFFFYKMFINGDYQRALHENNIRILPKKIFELLFDYKIYIILDIYGNVFINKEYSEYLDKVKAYSNYCMAYCPDKNVHDELRKYYDKVLDEIEDVLLQILDSQNLIFSKKSQNRSSLSLSENLLDGENCIIRELNMFKKNYYCNINQFMIFDYSIKWMEAINYFYSIILISLLNIDVEAMSDKIKNATFGRWKEIREEQLRKRDKCENINGKKKFKTFIEKNINDKDIIEKYKSVYEEIYRSKKILENETCSISFLLAEFSKIRNYTRGHGIYTFKITESLNENVLDILLYLMNSLIQSKLLECDFYNLSINGWVIYEGEDAYFCYSKDEGEEEYEYCCFSLGRTLRFPVDFFRRKNNEEE